MIFLIINIIIIFAGSMLYYKPKFSALSKRHLYLIILTFYIICTFLIYKYFNNLLAALLMSILPSSIVFLAIDIINLYKREKEQKQITTLVMSLSKWSLIKNNLVYCFEKTLESNIKNPTKALIKKATLRANSGMAFEKALELLAKESSSDNLEYLAINMKNTVLKGGDLNKLLRGLEEQYFKIDEELFKRKISSIRDRITIYILIVALLVVSYYFIASNPSVYDFYLVSFIGQNILGIFCVVFSIGVMYMVKG